MHRLQNRSLLPAWPVIVISVLVWHVLHMYSIRSEPTFSVYLSHSAYFVSIELIKELVETPLSLESLSSRLSISSEMRRVRNYDCC